MLKRQMTARTGKVGPDSHGRTTRDKTAEIKTVGTGKPRQDSPDRTVQTGQPGQDGHDRTAEMGQLWRDCLLESARTGQDQTVQTGHVLSPGGWCTAGLYFARLCVKSCEIGIMCTLPRPLQVQLTSSLAGGCTQRTPREFHCCHTWTLVLD